MHQKNNIGVPVYILVPLLTMFSAPMSTESNGRKPQCWLVETHEPGISHRRVPVIEQVDSFVYREFTCSTNI